MCDNASKLLLNSASKKIIDQTTSKKSKITDKKIPNSLISNNSKQSNCYKTPMNSKNLDTSYSKMEMPVSYQLTNGRCIRLKNSQNYQNIFDEEEINSETSSQNNNMNIPYNLDEEEESKSKLVNRSLMNYGNTDSIYPMKFVKQLHKKEQESQKFGENGMKTYKKFNLMVNPSYAFSKKFTSSPIHKYLPYCKKDDEKYKKSLISYIRKKAPLLNGAPKSVTCTYANNNINQKNNDEMNFFVLKKKKKIYSQKNVFTVEKDFYSYRLINGKNRVDYDHPKKFKIYYDNDIGFNSRWQAPLILANCDDDIETDDEVLDMAEEKCFDDIEEGINTWNKSSMLCRNFVLARKLNKPYNTPIFNKIAKKFQNNKDNSGYDIHTNDNNFISFGKNNLMV